MEPRFEQFPLPADRAGDTQLTYGAGDQLNRRNEIRARDSRCALTHQLGNHLLQMVRAQKGGSNNVFLCARVCGRPHGRARRSNGAQRRGTTGVARETAERAARFSGAQVEALQLVFDAETTTERDRLGRWVPSLATIGSVSPLIGLLGTVLGVIDAFVGIAAKGSGNIGAVAPGVAEALIATAAALSVAIPAVFAYNIFAARLNKIEGQLESFGSELIALMVREGMI